MSGGSFCRVGFHVGADWRVFCHTDLEADRRVANTLAELIIGGTLASVLLGTKPQENESSDEDKADDQGDEDPAT